MCIRDRKTLKLDFDENVEIIAKNFGFKSRVDLYYALSNDEMKISDIKNFTIENGKISFKPASELVKNAPITDVLKKIQQRPSKANKSNILVNGEPADIYQFSLASCCNPVPGDDIFAYLTSNSGLKIHRTSCPNATNLLANYGYRVLKADWEDNQQSNFVVELKVTGIDSGVGVIQALSNEISHKLGINIRSFSIEGNEGFFEGKIGIFVLNKDQLNQVVHSLENLEWVSTVERTDKRFK